MTKLGRSGAVFISGLVLSTVAGCSGSGIGCPANADSFDELAAATYAVVVGFQNGGTIAYSELGTAFAIGERLMATNAHITEFFNEPQGAPIVEVVAVQSGTGTVVTLLRALTHPEYNGNPLASQDVGLLTTQERLPVRLPLNLNPDLELGGDILLSGFPGNVNDIFSITPGTTVPQATSLTGQITALRSYNTNAVVTPDTIDFVQHQLPTSPGTSGSAIVQCGEVVAVNNAGTNKVALVVRNDGSVGEERIESASNNFGVHVKYLNEMVSLFQSNSIQGFELPPVAGGGGGGGGGGQTVAGTYAAQVATPANPHTFTITISANGNITGTSTWQNTGSFTLSGTVDANNNFRMTDNAGFDGTYIGVVNIATGQIAGDYFERGQFFASWTANRQ